VHCKIEQWKYIILLYCFWSPFSYCIFSQRKSRQDSYLLAGLTHPNDINFPVSFSSSTLISRVCKLTKRVAVGSKRRFEENAEWKLYICELICTPCRVFIERCALTQDFAVAGLIMRVYTRRVKICMTSIISSLKPHQTMRGGMSAALHFIFVYIVRGRVKYIHCRV